MSVASLKNGSLQLSELVISNDKYSNATGYVASSSTFTAGLTGTSISADSVDINGTLTVDNINSSTGTISSTGGFSCGTESNYGSTTVEVGSAGGGTITFCRNLTGGSDEIDITVINSYNSGDLTNPISSIYTSQTTIDGADVAGGTYVEPLVSLTTKQVNINGSLYPTSFVDSTGSSGTSGQVITANGTGGWSWA